MGLRQVHTRWLEGWEPVAGVEPGREARRGSVVAGEGYGSRGG